MTFPDLRFGLSHVHTHAHTQAGAGRTLASAWGIRSPPHTRPTQAAEAPSPGKEPGLVLQPPLLHDQHFPAQLPPPQQQQQQPQQEQQQYSYHLSPYLDNNPYCPRELLMSAPVGPIPQVQRIACTVHASRALAHTHTHTHVHIGCAPAELSQSLGSFPVVAVVAAIAEVALLIICSIHCGRRSLRYTPQCTPSPPQAIIPAMVSSSTHQKPCCPPRPTGARHLPAAALHYHALHSATKCVACAHPGHQNRRGEEEEEEGACEVGLVRVNLMEKLSAQRWSMCCGGRAFCGPHPLQRKRPGCMYAGANARSVFTCICSCGRRNDDPGSHPPVPFTHHPHTRSLISKAHANSVRQASPRAQDPSSGIAAAATLAPPPNSRYSATALPGGRVYTLGPLPPGELRHARAAWSPQPTRTGSPEHAQLASSSEWQLSGVCKCGRSRVRVWVWVADLVGRCCCARVLSSKCRLSGVCKCGRSRVRVWVWVAALVSRCCCARVLSSKWWLFGVCKCGRSRVRVWVWVAALVGRCCACVCCQVRSGALVFANAVDV